MIATPAVDPRAAAPAPPMMEAAPAATSGAASPPVNPVQRRKGQRSVSLNLRNDLITI